MLTSQNIAICGFNVRFVVALVKARELKRLMIKILNYISLLSYFGGHPNVGPFLMGTDVRSGWQDRRVCPYIRNGHLSNFRPSPK